MAHALKGQCLCGAVSFTATAEKLAMDACHCSMCRRWGGGPFMCVHVTDLAIGDAAALGVYSSSDWAERTFCKTCGTPLFWRMRDGSFIAANAQAFEAADEFAFETEIFIDEKPANYAFAGDTKKMTGADVAAAFSGNDNG